ncbi:hypothetical protein D8779_05890 [Pseudomonas leptonychotis]|uniref:Uncharacterized protein n=1 Tax=Pseudomonas leptonychotis TaxID=2448482 RepID=A0A4T2A4U7_9PSED|nr:hypothetical protein D8779_05890 [Pseudomonas leptonychotis]
MESLRVQKQKMGDIIARLSPHRKAMAIELIYRLNTKKAHRRPCRNLFRQPASPALTLRVR